VPVQRVVAYGYFDVATLKALGVLEDTLVAVTHPADGWYIDEIRQGMNEGRIAFLGDSSSIDFERLKQQAPELVLTWDYSVIPMLDALGIPCAITSTPTAMCLNARMRFVQFLAPFFQKEKEADAFFGRVNGALTTIRETTANAGPPPKVMWGDIYEKRVLVEPGNAWVGELVGLAESDYLFKDVYGTSCIEIDVERFLYSGEEADILFTYRTETSGVTSKAALARMNPLLEGIRPITSGKVYAPQPHYAQSGFLLDEILTEIAAILHPEVYPGYALRFFTELPDTDPAEKGGAA
jgi:iron complex transport system substrate-binding protein